MNDTDEHDGHGEAICFNCWLKARGIDEDLAAIIMSAGFLTGWEKGLRDAMRRGKRWDILLRMVAGEPDVTVEDQAAVNNRIMQWMLELQQHREHELAPEGHGAVPMSPEVQEAVARWGQP